MAKGRRYHVSRKLIAGCFRCFGSTAMWHASNAQALAAQHHDKTGHTTWAEVTMTIQYGDDAGKADPAQEKLL